MDKWSSPSRTEIVYVHQNSPLKYRVDASQMLPGLPALSGYFDLCASYHLWKRLEFSRAEIIRLNRDAALINCHELNFEATQALGGLLRGLPPTLLITET
jgi:hypothetical protein